MSADVVPAGKGKPPDSNKKISVKRRHLDIVATFLGNPLDASAARIHLSLVEQADRQVALRANHEQKL